MANLSTLVTSPTGNQTVGVNLVSNASDASTWVASGAQITVATTTVTSELPLGPTVPTAIKVTTVSNTTANAYTDFTVATALQNSKLQILWTQLTGGGTLATSYTLRIASYTDAARTLGQQFYTLSGGTTSLPSTYAIPVANGTFSQTFDTDTRVYYRLFIVQGAGAAAAHYLTIAGLNVTNQIAAQGAAVSSSISLAISTVGNLGTGSVDSTRTRLSYFRNGSELIVTGSIRKDGNAGSGASSVNFTLPISGITIDVTALQNNSSLTSTDNRLGAWSLEDTGGTNSGYVYPQSTTQLKFRKEEGASSSDFTGADFAANRSLTFGPLVIPIAEWAGSGVVNLGPGAQVEYAADDGSADVFGPNGAPVPNVAFGTGTTQRVFSFSTPPSASQLMSLELNPVTAWGPSADFLPFTAGNNGNVNNFYGMRGYWLTATTYVVEFGNQGTRVNASNADNGAASWATVFASGYRFRVAKANPSSPVGFSAATNDTYGLIKLSQISGAGEKNYFTSGTSDSSGWVASGAGISVASETSSANLPENSTKTSALKVLRASGSDYARQRFTLDVADYGKKLKIQWNQKYAGSTGDYTISVFSNTLADYTGTSTSLALSSTSIPALNGSNTVTFDAPNATAPYIEVRINGIAGTTALYLSGIVVGPGVVAQGGVVSEWSSYSPTIGGTSTNGTVAYTIRECAARRVGSAVEVQAAIVVGTVSVAPTGFLTISLPFNLTPINPVSSAPHLGTGVFVDDSLGTYIPFRCEISAGKLYIVANGATAIPTLAVNDQIKCSFTVPVAEWAGSGTVNLGTGAQVEYAFNTGSNTGANTSDTTSFGYGPAGTPILAINSTTANATTDFRCRFQYPIQQDDVIVVEVNNNGAGWFDAQYLMPQLALNTSFYGIQLTIVSSTDVLVSFGNQGFRGANAATYAASGQAWSAVTTYRWRVRKSKAGVPTGFGAATQTDLGLITLNQLKSDELNVITYHSDSRGWVATGAGMTLSTTQTTTELPLLGVIGTGIKIINVSGTTDEIRYDFVMPPAMKTRKLKIQWEQLIESGYLSTDTVVDLKSYSDSGRTTSELVYTLSSDDVSGNTYVPATNGRFLVTFDADSRDYYRLVLKRAAGTKYLVLANVIVGPGIQEQTAAISDLGTTTSITTTGFGTPSSISVKYYRRGSLLRAEGYFVAGTVTGATATISLPFSLTIEGTGNIARVAGRWWRDVSTASTRKTSLLNYNPIGGPSVVSFGNDDYTTNAVPDGNLGGATVCNTGDLVYFEYEIPIAQWASSGTVNLGQGALVEYASNTGAGGTAASTQYATGSVPGPAGSLFVAVDSTTVTAREVTDYVVSFQYAIQNDDTFDIEVLWPGTTTWVSLSTVVEPLRIASGAAYGMSVIPRDSSSVWVRFGNGGRVATGGYGAAGTAWSALSTYRWRVRKSKAGSPVGFGIATSLTSGLLPAGVYDNITGAWTYGVNGTSYLNTINSGHTLAGSILRRELRFGTGTLTTPSGGNAYYFNGMLSNPTAAVMLSGFTALSSDSGTEPVVQLLARGHGTDAYGSPTTVNTRPILGIYNHTTLFGSVSAAGALLMGPSTGGTLEHTFQSGNNTYIVAKSATNALAGVVLYNAASLQWNLLNNGGASNVLELRNAANNVILSATQAGAYVIGPTAGLGSNGRNTVYGAIVNEANGFTNSLASLSNAANVELNCNYFTDGTNTRKAIASVTGYTSLTISRNSAAGSTCIQLDSNYQNAQTANSALVTTNTAITLLSTMAGAWTLGPNVAADVEHTLRGGPATQNVLTINNNAASPTYAQIRLQLAGSTKGYWGASATNPFQVTNSAGTQFLVSVDDTGASVHGSGSLQTNTTGHNMYAAPNSTVNSFVPILTLTNSYSGTATNTDNNYNLWCVKPSTTSTSVQKFVRFSINNGSTNSGTIGANGADAAGFAGTSDIRKKQNILDLPSMLEKVKSLRPVDFEYISQPGDRQQGFIAQEIIEVFPEHVSTDPDGFYELVGWDRQKVILVKALQEQQTLIEELQRKVLLLESK